ncbi:MAG: hypothetical protein ACOC4M_02640 [Promethearchaeia archaeon]
MSKEEVKKLKEQVDEFRKKKIIMQAKLRKKEEKITDLNKKLRTMSVKSKKSKENKELNNEIKELKEKLDLYKKNNKKLRRKNSNLSKELDKTKSKLKNAKSEKVSNLEKVNLPGSKEEENEIDSEEVKYFRKELEKKDQMIEKLSEQLDKIQSGEISGGDQGGGAGGGYMQVRKLNSRIRELQSQLEMAKKSEQNMKQRLMKMQREQAAREEFEGW